MDISDLECDKRIQHGKSRHILGINFIYVYKYFLYNMIKSYYGRAGRLSIN